MSSKNAGRAKGVRFDTDGNISHLQFENRRQITPLHQAINMTERGETRGVRVSQTGAGRQYLQDIPDSSTFDNLRNLPEV